MLFFISCSKDYENSEILLTQVDPSETSRMEELKEFFETGKQKQIDYTFYDDCWAEDRITPFTINPDWTKVQVHRLLQYWRYHLDKFDEQCEISCRIIWRGSLSNECRIHQTEL